MSLKVVLFKLYFCYTTIEVDFKRCKFACVDVSVLS